MTDLSLGDVGRRLHSPLVLVTSADLKLSFFTGHVHIFRRQHCVATELKQEPMKKEQGASLTI